MYKQVIPKLLTICCFFLFWIGACTKTLNSEACEDLNIAMMSDNENMAKTAINHFLNSLSSKIYTQQNMETLVNTIESSCSCEAELLCFDCITTFPSQSEILVSFTSSGSTTTRVFDLSYTRSNTIEFRNMHE